MQPVIACVLDLHGDLQLHSGQGSQSPSSMVGLYQGVDEGGRLGGLLHFNVCAKDDGSAYRLEMVADAGVIVLCAAPNLTPPLRLVQRRTSEPYR